MNRRVFVLLVVICSTGAVLSAQGTGQRTFRYFKQIKTLRLETSTFLALPAENAAPRRVREALRRRAIAESDVRQFALKPWIVVRTPLSKRADAAYESLIDELARDAAFAFVSPQWLDAYGGAVSALPVLYVGFDPRKSATEAGKVLAKEGAGTPVARDVYGVPGAWRLLPPVKSGVSLLALAARLGGLPEVRFAEPEFVTFGRLQGGRDDDDPDLPRAWALQGGPTAARAAVGAPEAWRLTRGSPDIPVLVMDCGVEKGHPDLEVAVAFDASSADKPGDGAPGSPLDGHGTAVAGVISATAENDVGASGLAPGCPLLSARVYRADPHRAYVTETAAIARALAFGRGHGARVSNFSAYLSLPSALSAAAFERARALGMLHFAAAGNYATDALAFPASLPFVRSVVAITKRGDLASFSNFGGRVDFAAPGVDIFTTDLRGMAGFSPGDFTSAQGTSFAAPFAAGAAALVLSVDRSLSPDAVENILFVSAVDYGDRGRDPTFGHGGIHAGRAVALAAAEERPSGAIVHASSAVSGLQSDGPSSEAAFSGDGRWIAFASEATTLGPDDRNGVADLFVAPTDGSGGPRRLRLTVLGRESAGASREPSLSQTGRFVAFTSYASLSPLDRNGVRDVYVHDRDVDGDGVFDEAEPGSVATHLASRAPGGGAGDGPSMSPAISPDGDVVVFESAARNLVRNDDDDVTDVLIAHLTTDGWQVVARPSAAPTGFRRGDSRHPVISGDGSTLAFETRSDGLVPDDQDGRSDVYILRLLAGGLPVLPPIRGGTRPDGRGADGESRRPCLSDDGSVVVFTTTASDLEDAPRAPGTVRLAMRRDGVVRYLFDPAAEVGVTPPPGVAASAAKIAKGTSLERVTPILYERPTLTKDGSAVWFIGIPARSGARWRDVYVAATSEGSAPRSMFDLSPGSGRASGVALSRNGAWLAFDSDSDELVPDDTNLRRDVFLLEQPR